MGRVFEGIKAGLTEAIAHAKNDESAVGVRVYRQEGRVEKEQESEALGKSLQERLDQVNQQMRAAFEPIQQRSGKAGRPLRDLFSVVNALTEITIDENNDDLQSLSAKVSLVIDNYGPLSTQQLALLLLLSKGYTESEALSLCMKKVSAGRPRERGESKTGGKAFVAAVKSESGKKLWNTAWGWMESKVDEVFSGFEIIKITESEVSFKATEKNKKTAISKGTFRTYWAVNTAGKSAKK